MNGLYAIKPGFVRRLKGVEDALVARRVSPDALTASAVLMGLLAGSAIALGAALDEPVVWLFVPVLGLLRLALNALDGSVARRTGTGRPFGEVLNEMGDRVSDAVLLVALAFVAPVPLVFAALVATQLASTAGTLGRVVGDARLSTGPMGKADRVAVVSVAALASGITSGTTPFAVAAAAIAIGAALTTATRIATLHRISRVTA